MATVTRPELSEKNRWWISKHRYYELRHFCLQYPEWKALIEEIDGFPQTAAGAQEPINSGKTGDPTPAYAEARMAVNRKIQMVEKAAFEACDHQFWYTILIPAVTAGESYDKLEARFGMMPISRSEWYSVYRKFFWMLDKMRD